MILDNPTFDSTSGGFSGGNPAQICASFVIIYIESLFVVVKCSTLNLYVVDYFNNNPRINVRTDFYRFEARESQS